MKSQQRLFMLAFAVVIASNLLVLAKVAYNRANVVSSITLSEREFSPRYFVNDVTFLPKLRVAWETQNSDYYSHALTADKNLLKRLGFSEHCQSYLENKSAFVLMELNGNAFQTDKTMHLQRLTQELNDDNNHARKTHIEQQIKEWEYKKTRLYATAVALKADTLYAALRDKNQFIISGEITADCDRQQIFIKQLGIKQFSLPSHEDKKRPDGQFTATIHIGKLGDAWLQQIAFKD